MICNMKMVFFIILTFLTACSHKGVKPINAKGEVEKNTYVKLSALFPKEGLHLTVMPGMVNFFEFTTKAPNGLYHMKCRGKDVSFIVQDGRAKGYLGENYFSNMKPFQCLINDSKEDIIVAQVKVVPYHYKSEKLNVDKKRIELSAKDLKRVIKEKEIKKNIYLKSAPYFLFSSPFMIPLDSKVTSYYGTKRLFNNKKQSQHLGNDYRAKVGVKIPVANDGRVVFTGDLFFSGKIVVVDHGLNIFTIYGHLSKINVSEGSMIKKGDIVGLAGATGRVSGPHLHWGVKVNGSWVDGHSLVKASKLQFPLQTSVNHAKR